MNPPFKRLAEAHSSRAEEEPELFATTHWTSVIAAARGDLPGATGALERLCQAYWRPIYVFIRRRGADTHEAEDLTQAFFARLLEKNVLSHADRTRGKFRNFLMASIINFLSREWDRRLALKRGGGRPVISLDELMTEEGFLKEQSDAASPDKLFDRRWAQTVVQQTHSRLAAEYAAAGKAQVFETLEAGLTAKVTAPLRAQWAETLAMSDGAVRVALHRLRRRFGDLLRAEIAQTVSSPEEIDDEIRHLFAVLCQ